MTAVPTTAAPAGQSPPTTPAIPEQRAPRRRTATRSARLLRNTPNRLTVILAVVLTLIATAGAASVADSVGRTTVIDEASGQRGRMAIAAFDMYRALSDADAAAASAFLPGNTTMQTDLRDAYEAGISRASTAITALADEANSQKQVDIVARLSATLPVYTGLVETARTYHRQGLPLGLAYLRDASTLVREDMLPKVDQLQSTAMADLGGAKDDATAFPWLAGIAMLLTLGVLVYGQVTLTRRTSRFINIGLATATLALLVSGGWMLVSWNSAASHIDAGHQNGTQPLELLSQAHIGAQQARSDEALTLIAQGTNTDYEAEFQTIMTELIGEDGNGGTLAQVRDQFDDPTLDGYVEDAIVAAQQWSQAHQQLREMDDNGDYKAAVAMATSGDADSAGASFAALNDALTFANELASKSFTDETDAAADALTATGIGFALLTLVAMISAAMGMQRRISEYR